MAAVAVAALITAVGVGLVRRRSAFQQQAALYARESDQEFLSGRYIEARYHAGPSVLEKLVLEAHYRRSDHFAALRAKYEWAARHPWLPVPPDPPEPK